MNCKHSKQRNHMNSSPSSPSIFGTNRTDANNSEKKSYMKTDHKERKGHCEQGE
jgi:hypothetical protein